MKLVGLAVTLVATLGTSVLAQEEIDFGLIDTIFDLSQDVRETDQSVNVVGTFRLNCATGVMGTLDIDPDEHDVRHLNSAEVGLLCSRALRQDTEDGNIFSMQERIMPTSLLQSDAVTGRDLARAIFAAAEARQEQFSQTVAADGTLIEHEEVRALPGRVFDSAYALVRTGAPYIPELQRFDQALSGNNLSQTDRSNLLRQLTDHATLVAQVCYANRIPDSDIYNCLAGGQLLAMLEAFSSEQ